MYSRDDVNKIINDFLRLVSGEFSLREAYLFGSYAQGRANEYSDIDLAIVSDCFEGDRFDDKKKLNKYILKTSTDLEIHPYNTLDFNSDNPFVEEVIKKGIKIEIPLHNEVSD